MDIPLKLKRYYLDKQGKPFKTMEEWSHKLGDFKYRVVKQETLPNGKWVSTIWIGLDMSMGEGRPLIFETMVFPKQGVWSDLDMDRYSTEKQAIAGHKRMVKKWSIKPRVKRKPLVS